MTTLPPVAEFMASFQHSTETPDYYGSTFSGTLIDAARSGTGSVSRFIRSRSEDSVCNTNAPNSNTIRESVSRSNSPGSDEGVTASPTDSNPSMDKPEIAVVSKSKHKEQHSHLYGFGALAALKRKRKKFSKSRNTSPILEPTAAATETDAAKILKRASSVPSRTDDNDTQLINVTQSTNGPTEGSGSGITGRTMIRSASGLTPSTTDESVKCSTSTSPPSSSGGVPTSSNQQTSEINSGQLLPHLPNITPVRGHTSYQGWL